MKLGLNTLASSLLITKARARRSMLRKTWIVLFIAIFSMHTVHAPISFASSKKRHIPQCRDKKDNDKDGKKDYPRDPGCRSRNDDKERDKKRDAPTPTPTPASPGDHSGVDLGDGASFHGIRVFPDDNAWNKDISNAEIDPNSNNLIASIGANTGLHPDFGTVWEGAPIGIPYVVVPGDQLKQKIKSFWYPDESDDVPYPIPAHPPIEGGDNGQGDRHILMIDRDNWKLYELYAATKDGDGWQAGSGAVFNLNSNEPRHAGWTSADAAGLPIFPGLARYDEVVEQGEIRHALRFTVQHSRRAYVPPASHYASSNQSVDLPPMGMRVRLKASFDISSFSPHVQVILRALKKYGMIVADNGSNWFISGAPDSRWDDDELGTLRQVKGSDFEVVKMEGLVAD